MTGKEKIFFALRRLKWNLSSDEIAERGGDQIEYGDEVCDIPVVPGFCPRVCSGNRVGAS